MTIIQNSLERLFTKPNHTIIEESESIAQALAETRRLTGLTADLLTIARSDSNQLLLTKETIELAPFIDDLVKPFKEIAELDQKHFVVENFAKTTACFDQKKIHQVLVILLDNALKYTSSGDKITLLSEISNKQWLIEVKTQDQPFPMKKKPVSLTASTARIVPAQRDRRLWFRLSDRQANR